MDIVNLGDGRYRVQDAEGVPICEVKIHLDTEAFRLFTQTEWNTFMSRIIAKHRMCESERKSKDDTPLPK